MYNKFKTMGEITQEQREYIWDKMISGSQFKELIEDPIRVYEEKIGKRVKKGFFDGMSPQQEQFVQEALDRGHTREPAILARATQKWDTISDIMEDKSTFQSTLYPMLTANVDGVNFGFSKLIEIKSSGTKELKDPVKGMKFLVSERYVYQILYYMAFMNADELHFVVESVNGIDWKNLTEEEWDNLPLYRRIVKKENNKELIDMAWDLAVRFNDMLVNRDGDIKLPQFLIDAEKFKEKTKEIKI